MALLEASLSEDSNAEKIRDAIAVLLAQNVKNQQDIAVSEGKDSRIWDVRVHMERSNTVGDFLQAEDSIPAVINVWLESVDYGLSESMISQKQAASAIYNIDVIGYGVSSDADGFSHVAGDEQAARAAQKVSRFSRSVLMSPAGLRLDMPKGLILRQWVSSIRMAEGRQGNDSAIQVVAARVAFEVNFYEFEPGLKENPLSDFRIDIVRDADGAILAQSRIIADG